MKYGILGGTFDPPHLGHLHIAQEARRQLALDEVVWVPVFRNPLKRFKRTDAEQRLAMCRLAVEGCEHMAVSDIEVTRGGDSYLVDTLYEFKMVMPGEYWFIVGTDALSTFPDWKRPEEITRMCRLAVFSRPGTDFQTVLSRLGRDVRDRIDVVKADAQSVSSSNIRDMAVRGEDFSHALAPAVYAYIKENNLYQED